MFVLVKYPVTFIFRFLFIDKITKIRRLKVKTLKTINILKNNAWEMLSSKIISKIILLKYKCFKNTDLFFK